MSFSKRMGFEPAQKALQLDGMDDELRMELHNIIRSVEKDVLFYKFNLDLHYRCIWTRFFFLDLDECTSRGDGSIRGLIKSEFMSLPWQRVYDYIEFYLTTSRVNPRFHEKLESLINQILHIHNSGYRIQDCIVIPISNELELSEISEASHSGQKAIDTHMKRAIELFSKRETKDYANVIKEAITAVEAAVNFVNGTEGKTLGDALKTLDKNHKLPDALRQGMEKLYIYTNDKQSGIRHAMINDATCPPDFADAKFMLVACSAFVNWLLQRIGA